MTASRTEGATTHRWHLTGAFRQNLYGTMFGFIFTLLLLLCLFISFKSPADRLATCTAMGITAALCFFPIVIGLLFRPMTVTVSPDRIVWWGIFGGGDKPWSEVVDLYRREILNAGNARGMTKIRFQGGPTLKFGQALMDYDVLANRIQNEATRAGIAAARSAFAAGEFRAGTVSMKAAGLAVGNTHIPWSELDGFTLISGQLCLLGTSSELDQIEEIWLHRLPNYEVLLRMLEERGLVYRPWSPSGLAPLDGNDP